MTSAGERPSPLGEPETLEVLLGRARSIAGATVGELASAHGLVLPTSMTHGKGFVGTLLERVLGASAGSRSEPDFPSLGVELKTLPMDTNGRVLESTFVATIPLTALSNLEYASSPIGAKLARVLFIPIEGRPVPLATRRIGAPLYWIPDAAETAILERDFDCIAESIGRGELERVSAHAGEAMQVRPKAARASVRTLHFDEDGHARSEQPRGVYLRARFTARIVARLRAEGTTGAG